MVRGTGKFKQKRGGGRNFSRNMTLDEDGHAVGHSTLYDRRDPRNSDDDEDDSEEEESEEEEEEEEESEDETPGNKQPTEDLSRAERRDLKKKQAAEKQATKQKTAVDGDEDDVLINPNHVERKLNISDLGESRELTRRERDEKEKKEAKERYWKLHLQGKTQEAKTDLARLAKIRAEREQAQAKRKAEAEAKAAEIEAKRKIQLSKRGA